MASKENRTGLIIAGLLLGMFMASMDQTIVATAMGTIVSDLGGLENFVWVTSAYLVSFLLLLEASIYCQQPFQAQLLINFLCIGHSRLGFSSQWDLHSFLPASFLIF